MRLLPGPEEEHSYIVRKFRAESASQGARDLTPLDMNLLPATRLSRRQIEHSVRSRIRTPLAVRELAKADR